MYSTDDLNVGHKTMLSIYRLALPMGLRMLMEIGDRSLYFQSPR